jgi:DNA-binding Lrp family transcriptional regulator
MARAYLKLNVVPGQDEEIRKLVLLIKGVKSAELTSGAQDIMCLVEAASFEEIYSTIVPRIHKISGVTEVVTDLILERP